MNENGQWIPHSLTFATWNWSLWNCIVYSHPNDGEQAIFLCPNPVCRKQSYYLYCHFRYFFLLFFLVSIIPFLPNRQISICLFLQTLSTYERIFTLLYSLHSFHVSRTKEYNLKVTKNALSTIISSKYNSVFKISFHYHIKINLECSEMFLFTYNIFVYNSFFFNLAVCSNFKWKWMSKSRRKSVLEDNCCCRQVIFYCCLLNSYLQFGIHYLFRVCQQLFNQWMNQGIALKFEF